MSNNYKYSMAIPENNRDVFFQNDPIHFQITGDNGYSLLKNSLRLEGNISIKQNGTVVAAGESVFLNPKTGIQSILESCQVSTQNGLVENLSNSMGRYAMMRETATQSKNSSLNGSKASELKMPSINQVKEYSSGCRSQTNQVGSQVIDPVSFSMKPLICLNRMLPDQGNVSFDRVGYLRLSIILARDLSVLTHNMDSDPDLTYEITNLTCHYVQVPEGPMDNTPIMCRSYVPVKQTLNSNVSAINSRVPTTVDSVAISFQKFTNENSKRVDNSAMEHLDGLEKVNFQFNNTVEGVKYELEDHDDMVQRFLKAFNYQSQNDANKTMANKADLFGVGLNFELPRSLQSTTFNTLITTTGVNNNNKYNVYLYFHSMVQV